jgi:uncharacterized protein with FMN-binding domain
VFLVVLFVIISCSSLIAGIYPSLPDLNNIQDGTYRGEYSLPRSPLKAILDVTVKNHILTAINIIEHNCSPVGKKAEGIIDKIIEFQNLDIDVISGATLSSKTIKMAVQKALEP